MVKLYPFNLHIYPILILGLLTGSPFSKAQEKLANRSEMSMVLPDKYTINRTNSITTTQWNGNSWDFGMPDSSLNAVIAGAYTGAGFTCKDLEIQEGRAFRPSSSVVVVGKFTNPSSQIQGVIHLRGIENQLVRGFADDLILENPAGARLSATTTVFGTLSLKSGTLQTLGNLIFHSSSTKTARLGRVSSGASVEGSAMVRRFVPGNQAAWHFMGVPLSGQTRADWADDFTVLPNSVFRHNEGGSTNIDDQVNGWEYAGDNLTTGVGYRTFLNQSFFNGGASFDNQGLLLTGNFQFPIAYTPTGYDGGGWNFLANPYACEIDWHSISRNNVDGQIHFWNQDQYASYSIGTGIGVNGGGRYIPSCQAFFVKATAASATLTASEESKPETPQNSPFLRIATGDPLDVARLTLRGPGGTSDETAIRWMQSSNPYFESGFDADKLINPGISLFSNTSEGRKASIQARNFDNSDVVDVGFHVDQPGSYFLQIKMGSEIFSGKTWELRDNETGFIYPMTAEMLFPFQVVEGSEQSNYRFSLIGLAPLVDVKKNTKASLIQAFPNPSSGKINLRFEGQEIPYQILNLQGKEVTAGICKKENGAILDVSSITPGSYLLQVRHETEIHSVRIQILNR